MATDSRLSRLAATHSEQVSLNDIPIHQTVKQLQSALIVEVMNHLSNHASHEIQICPNRSIAPVCVRFSNVLPSHHHAYTFTRLGLGPSTCHPILRPLHFSKINILSKLPAPHTSQTSCHMIVGIIQCKSYVVNCARPLCGRILRMKKNAEKNASERS